METLMKPDELAKILGISRRTLDRMDHDGELTSVPVRGRKRYRKSDVERYLAQQEPHSNGDKDTTEA